MSLLKATDKGSEVLERRKGWRQHRAAMRGRLLGANQMRDKGMTDTYEQVLQAVRDRDEQDMNRKVEPLRQAADAVLVDSTQLTFQQVVEAILRVVEEKCHG